MGGIEDGGFWTNGSGAQRFETGNLKPEIQGRGSRA